MALLILNEEETYAAGQTPETERYYEFDPNDKAAIKRIHTILSSQKKVSTEKSKKELVDVCTRSLENTSSNTCTMPVTGWFRKLSGYIPKFNSKNSIHNDTKLFNLLNGRISNIRIPNI